MAPKIKGQITSGLTKTEDDRSLCVFCEPVVLTNYLTSALVLPFAFMPFNFGPDAILLLDHDLPLDNDLPYSH